MIKLEHTLVPTADEMEFVIEGMRNPMNSWNRSDTEYFDDEYILGENDFERMNALACAGPVHAKYRRMMTVMVRITAPLYWWKEFDTYKVGTVSNSCSTMHKIHAKKFEHDDFSEEHMTHQAWNVLDEVIWNLNENRELFLETKDEKHWWNMIQLLPSSYNQTRNISMNYEVLANIYTCRKGHKLDEWRIFREWIESLPYSILITGEDNG